MPRRLSAWLELFRVSATPTAASNILAGFLIARGDWLPVGELLLLIASSCLLYTSGMVLNDICDYEYDSRHRVTRPLPTARISRRAAWLAYAELTLLGLVFSLLAGRISLVFAISLVGAIAAYNRWLKSTPWAPLAMGLCRFLNVLLGASTLLNQPVGQLSPWPLVLAFGLGVGTLIVGITWFAQRENEAPDPKRLIRSAVVVGLGLAGFMAIGCIKFLSGDLEIDMFWSFSGLLAMVNIPAVFRLIPALRDPTEIRVQACVGTLLRSLILYDATICYLFSGGELFYPLVVAGLLVPSAVLSRWVSST
jgi:4-hydroxybenzoate polyprenyltransferase